ncbi:hypothetical protein T552_00399 [Pneumocystis carinii B80]|uniref:Large ribosomal subunit protein eL24-related N-terminal domain-containing protein n=1 Tax=Pneumocystis carinii (strain B80) TaxID=1408658 RepID=A0A0W4ZQN2_PNEC8|nr:hypothetical protein T552_00399 [Pneumocystis carinii B80]KTW30686.1 hypothetical protein T552_00399 [Pneumocystis carinii B80]
MKIEVDSFGGSKIYPGKGKIYVRGDNKVFRFSCRKTGSLFIQRKNPRKITWTILYRRMHKKGITEEVAKKRARRTMKFQRAIVGASLEVIRERQNQREEVRLEARRKAIKEGKEKKQAQESLKRANKAKLAVEARGTVISKVSKQQARGVRSKILSTTR